ncbi:MAG: DUF3857 domain-containing protein [Prevotella sp.]|nr:DUF3857 domain-containing protein [Prevotella sp.]
MRLYLFLLSFISINVFADSIEPNLKWGNPTKEELTMTEYAPDKDADAVVLCQQVKVYYQFLNNDFRVFRVVKGRLKVLKPEGKRVADLNVQIWTDESNSQNNELVTGLKATAYNLKDGKVIKTKMDHSMVFREQVSSTETRIKFSVPQVQVGTVFEYEYTLESGFFFELRDWYAQSDIPVLYTQYSLSVPEWFSFHIEETGINRLERKTGAGSLLVGTRVLTTNENTFVGRELPALKNDDYIWHAEDYGNKVTHELQGIYIPGALHKNFTSTWNDVDRLLLNNEDFGGRMKRSSPLKNEIIAAGIPQIDNVQQRVEATWKMLWKHVKWNGQYAFWAKSGASILKEGTGSNADINFLFINMLRDANVEASPVVLRLRNRGLLPRTHASLKYLSTFIVGVQMNDSTMCFFDSSAHDGYLNVLPACLYVKQARVIRKDRPGQWVNLQPLAQSTENTLIQASLRANGELTGDITNSWNGEAAANLRRQWHTGKDSADVIYRMQERMHSNITHYESQGLHDFSPIVREKINFEKRYPLADNRIYLDLLPIYPFGENPFIAETRILPVELPYKHRKTINMKLNLADGWQIEEIPDPVVVRYDGITARMMAAQEENQLTVAFKLDIQRTFFSQQEYPALRLFFEKLVESCKNVIVLKKVEK